MIKAIILGLALLQGTYAYTDMGNGVANSVILNPDPNPPKIDPLNTQESDIILKDGKNKNALADEVHRWPEGIIPYEFHSNFSTLARQVVNAAIQDYNNFTCLHWRLRTASDVNYVTHFLLDQQHVAIRHWDVMADNSGFHSVPDVKVKELQYMKCSTLLDLDTSSQE